MFKKNNRLNRSEFEGFFNTGLRKHSQNLQLIYSPQSELKVAVVVPKKIIKTAVGRNKLRRQLYHQLKKILSQKTGVYICIVKKSIIEAALLAQFQELKNLFGVIDVSR